MGGKIFRYLKGKIFLEAMKYKINNVELKFLSVYSYYLEFFHKLVMNSLIM